jgi:excisionase family DNA binding protein
MNTVKMALVEGNTGVPANQRTVILGECLCLSVAETAQSVGVSKPTVRAAIAQGHLKVARTGRRVLVPVVSIEKWLLELMTQDGHGISR